MTSSALGIIGLWKAISSGKAATQAKLDAKMANDRAEEALTAAKRLAEALAGLHEAEQVRLANEQAEREAPGILREWIHQAIIEGREASADFRLVVHDYPFKHERITSLAELFAARLAANDPGVDGMSPNPRFGEPFAMRVRNPQRAGA